MEQRIRAVGRFQVNPQNTEPGAYRVLEASQQVRALPGYRAVVTEIDSLLADDDYDSNYQRPTEDAIRRGEDFLAQTLQQVRGEFPIADPVPDGNGGFRLYWMKPGKNLQLNVPATGDQQLSVFWREGVRFALDQGPSAANLAERLAWFSGG